MPKPIKPKIPVVEVPTQPEPEIKPTPTADKPKRERKKAPPPVDPVEVKAAVDEIRKEEAPIIVERTARKGDLTPEVEEALNKGDLKTWVGWAGEPGKLAAAAIKVMRAVPPLMEARFAHLGETLVFPRPVGSVESAEVVSADSGRVRVKTDDGRFSEVSPSAEVFVIPAGSVLKPKAMPTVHGRPLPLPSDGSVGAPKIKREGAVPNSGNPTVFGQSRKGFVVWATLQGWTAEEIAKTFFTLGVSAVGSIKQFMGWAREGKATPASFTSDQVAELLLAAGKSVQTPPKGVK